MEYSTIQYEKTGGVGVITINRPKVLNALNVQVIRELSDVFRVMDEDCQVHCVVVIGAGRAFIAGADVSDEIDNDVRQEHQFLRSGHELMNQIERFRTPVIAAINGYALGGGLELAMACDVRIASEKAKMGLPEINLASIPALGGTHRLSMLVGLARAKEMVFSGRHITASEAYSYGLVQQVVPPEKLMDTVMAMADKIAARAPLTVEYGKIALNAGYWSDSKLSSEMEMGLRCQLQDTQDRKEAYRAFLEKREPAPFTGR